jgi:phage terminase large subunit
VSHNYFRKTFIQPFRDQKETDTRFVPFTIDDNPHVDGGNRTFLDNLTGWLKRAWRYGDWDIAAGQFFTTFSERHHVVDDIDERRAKSWFCGFDYGMVHYTVCILGFWDGDGNAWIVDSHGERRWLVPRHVEAIRAMLGRHNVFESGGGYASRLESRSLTLDDLDYFVAGTDVFSKQSNGRTVADEYKEHGIKFGQANTDRINGAANLLRLLGDPDAGQPAKLKIHRRCARLLEQLPAMQHDPGRPEDMLKVDCDDDGQGGDDDVDGLRYALMHRHQGIRMQKLTGF